MKEKKEEKRFTLRMNAELFDRVAKLTEKSKRSVAKEIEYLLEQYFEEQDKAKND